MRDCGLRSKCLKRQCYHERIPMLTYRLIINIAVNLSIVMLILLATQKKQWKSHHYSSVLITKDQKSLGFRSFRS